MKTILNLIIIYLCFILQSQHRAELKIQKVVAIYRSKNLWEKYAESIYHVMNTAYVSAVGLAFLPLFFVQRKRLSHM
jgi:hypothetical protein